MTEGLTSEQIDKGLEVFQGLADSKLLTNLNSCVHCGLCAESCIYYLTTGDPRLIPARKVDLVASLYKRYNTFTGRMMPGLTGARNLDSKTVDEMTDLLFGACTMCGRCTSHCSVGIDIAYLVKTGRTMLSNMGLVPASLQSTVNAALETGNNMGIPEDEFLSTLQWMEEELADDLQHPDARIPVNETGKNVLYTLNPREPKFFPLSISAMAKIFFAAGESWTLSTKMYDVTNYAYFSGNQQEASVIAKRLSDEIDHLKTQTLVLAECGHGSRAFRWEAPNYLKQCFPFRVMTSVELIAGYLREGRIRLDPAKIKERVTLHDPCNLVRNGGVILEQRYILHQFVKDFVEMDPAGTDNYCCGGGGGQLAMSEYNVRRIKIAGIKAEQIRKTGAGIVVTPCHNCVDQLSQINFHYKMGIQVKTLAEIVADALILD
ncbi:MAG: (Fe-S)-binding protein [Bacteroidetes bacterium]|nr:(Fe-S)-binding protein [Bacteroidota bacterium]